MQDRLGQVTTKTTGKSPHTITDSTSACGAVTVSSLGHVSAECRAKKKTSHRSWTRGPPWRVRTCVCEGPNASAKGTAGIIWLTKG